MGGRTQTQTSTYELSPEQRALIEPAVAAGQAYAANPPQLPGYSQVAGFDPAQLAAQRGLLGQVMPMQQLADAAAASNRFLLDPSILDPNSNQYLRATIDAATRPITENLLESVLPSVRGSAISSGQFGGSRQGIAEGLSTGRAAQAVGDTAARISTAGYQSGLDAMTRAQALSPQILQNLAAPSLVQGAVGDVRRGMTQAKLSERAYKDLYAQIAPWLAAKEVAAVGAGLPGGTTTSTATTPGANPFQMLLGLGSLGAGLWGGGGLGGGAGISPQALMAIMGGSGGGLF